MYVGSLVNKGIPYSELSDKMEIFFSSLFFNSVLRFSVRMVPNNQEELDRN